MDRRRERGGIKLSEHSLNALAFGAVLSLETLGLVVTWNATHRIEAVVAVLLSYPLVSSLLDNWHNINRGRNRIDEGFRRLRS